MRDATPCCRILNPEIVWLDFVNASCVSGEKRSMKYAMGCFRRLVISGDKRHQSLLSSVVIDYPKAIWP